MYSNSQQIVKNTPWWGVKKTQDRHAILVLVERSLMEWFGSGLMMNGNKMHRFVSLFETTNQILILNESELS